jgi:hypothetical protein
MTACVGSLNVGEVKSYGRSERGGLAVELIRSVLPLGDLVGTKAGHYATFVDSPDHNNVAGVAKLIHRVCNRQASVQTLAPGHQRIVGTEKYELVGLVLAQTSGRGSCRCLQGGGDGSRKR